MPDKDPRRLAMNQSPFLGVAFLSFRFGQPGCGEISGIGCDAPTSSTGMRDMSFHEMVPMSKFSSDPIYFQCKEPMLAYLV